MSDQKNNINNREGLDVNPNLNDGESGGEEITAFMNTNPFIVEQTPVKENLGIRLGDSEVGGEEMTAFMNINPFLQPPTPEPPKED